MADPWARIKGSTLKKIEKFLIVLDNLLHFSNDFLCMASKYFSSLWLISTILNSAASWVEMRGFERFSL